LSSLQELLQASFFAAALALLDGGAVGAIFAWFVLAAGYFVVVFELQTIYNIMVVPYCGWAPMHVIY
jgi:hypothetical protein